MKLTDYIIHFLIQKGVTDIFGYPGGCINHLIDSAYKSGKLTAHLAYNEQGAAFAACGYAQRTNKLGVAYSTSGPGATNLITGIASAFFDAIPTLFITGQVDTVSEKGNRDVRQRGFQETDIVGCTEKITKWSYHLSNPNDIAFVLEKAYHIAFDGNPGPVVLDIPNDFQRAEIDQDLLNHFSCSSQPYSANLDQIVSLIKHSEKPLILIGNGVKQNQLGDYIMKIADKIDAPVVSSLPSFDVLPSDFRYNFGFIGTNGHRYSNFISEKCDLVLSLGNRMSIRTLGVNRELFAPNAKIVRVDIDDKQMNYHVRDDEICVSANLISLLPLLEATLPSMNHSKWLEKCDSIKTILSKYDATYSNEIIERISRLVPSNYDISLDIGQNLVWSSQSFLVKKGQFVLVSAGNGPMGYSIPAGIGSYYGSKRPVVSFCGDGGLMMNVQELQFLKRESIPNKVICLNNLALGMIRSWQARYMDKCSQTTEDSGYLTPDLKLLAKAFNMKYTLISNFNDLDNLDFSNECSELIEVVIPTNIDTIPNGNMHDQNPKIDRELFEKILSL